MDTWCESCFIIVSNGCNGGLKRLSAHFLLLRAKAGQSGMTDSRVKKPGGKSSTPTASECCVNYPVIVGCRYTATR